MQVDRWKTLAVSTCWTFGNVSFGHFVCRFKHPVGGWGAKPHRARRRGRLSRIEVLTEKRIKCCQIHFGSICFASQAPENKSGLHAEFSDRWLHLMAFWLEFSSRFATISWEQGKLPCSWMIWVYSHKPRAVLWSLVQPSFKTSPVLILNRVFGIRCGEFELHKACPYWALCWQTAAEAWDKARPR